IHILRNAGPVPGDHGYDHLSRRPIDMCAYAFGKSEPERLQGAGSGDGKGSIRVDCSAFGPCHEEAECTDPRKIADEGEIIAAGANRTRWRHQPHKPIQKVPRSQVRRYFSRRQPDTLRRMAELRPL